MCCARESQFVIESFVVENSCATREVASSTLQEKERLAHDKICRAWIAHQPRILQRCTYFAKDESQTQEKPMVYRRRSATRCQWMPRTIGSGKILQHD